MTRTGNLRHRILIQTPSTVQNALGEATGSPTTIATVWAKIVPLRGRERLRSEESATVARDMITIRYRTDVAEKMSVTVQATGVVYQIEYIADVDTRHQWLELTCRRVS